MERESIEVTTRAEWRTWLEQHHATSDGVWLVTWKKATPDKHVSYEEIVLEALCFGWVDSQAKGVDELRTSITMTPRRTASRWTQPNRDRVVALEDAGLMTDAGRAQIEAAKANGAWDELRPVEALQEPDDLATALDADPAARARWEALSRSARYQHLLRLHDTKRAETRAKRIAEITAE
ncbi:MAG: hypothetical protein JWO46_1077 [Nocardioidaceae bacterium]|nr:hypothetical protein [Nocardioidaceae bacterium]